MFTTLLESLTFILNIFSILIIFWGVILTFLTFLKLELFHKDSSNTIKKLTTLKNQLGTYILLGLEILICSDIIESILNPSARDILVLASIVIIRTVISYFLNKELETDNS